MGIRLTRWGSEIESIAIAVIAFLLGGVIIFFSCFIITKFYLCYKYNRKRRREERGGGSRDDEDFSYAIISEEDSADREFPA
ncbi:hypothetical protein QR680_017650 [Steinernema hermaphroditum]|uniref:Uncharacterized protein n=1 Tax=Steinernema hermaphroditum TaxID=289476 RepID=A0AA39HFZ3_9BILA|nr:hypothetical protein QR680_017650 [Steinernema hermaphroditum]